MATRRSDGALLTHISNLRNLDLRHLLFAPDPDNVRGTTPVDPPAPRPRFRVEDFRVEDYSASNKDISIFFDLICLFSHSRKFAFACGPWKVSAPTSTDAITCLRLSECLPVIRCLNNFVEYDSYADGMYDILHRSGALGG